MVIRFIYFLAFILIWVALAGWHPDHPHLMAFAFIVPALTLMLSLRLDILPTKNAFKISGLGYFFWLLKEIFSSALSVSFIAWRKAMMIQPIMEPVKTDQKTELGKIIYANSITLTPGTVTLSLEGRHLMVHALDVSFMEDLQEGPMDSKVLKIIR